MEHINLMSDTEFRGIIDEYLLSEAMARQLNLHRPFSNLEDLLGEANQIWNSLSKDEKMKSFMRHPKIGDISEVKRRKHSKTEQSGIFSASEHILEEFIVLNRAYEKKFGTIFLVFASGKSAQEMLDILKNRLGNNPEDEFTVASNEKKRINQLRLEKLVSNLSPK